MKQTIRILHTEASMGWGGQEIRILQESLGMIRRGYKVSVAAPEQSMIFRRANDSGIECFPASFKKKSLSSFTGMISLLNREHFDIVNTHSSSDSWITSIASKLSPERPKIIRTRHLSTPISRSVLSRLIYNVLPDAVMTTGEQIRRNMMEKNGFDGSRIISVPTGTDLEIFCPDKTVPSLKPSGFAIGMIGVLRSWKGHRFFVESMPAILKNIPDAVFYIVGDGPIKQNIAGLVDALPFRDRVFMTGHREDIPEIMASIDVIVHPSYANEGIPQSLLQAMAMERPVVASDAGAIKDIVFDGETGFLIEPMRPDLLAEKVVELYNDPGLRKKFGKRGRELVEREYSFEIMINKIEEIYRRLFDK